MCVLAAFSPVQAGWAQNASGVPPQPKGQSHLYGKITDDGGDPLPGVVVFPKGATNKAVTSDLDGNYSIPVTKGSGTVFVFQFLGMKTQEIGVSAPPFPAVPKWLPRLRRHTASTRHWKNAAAILCSSPCSGASRLISGLWTFPTTRPPWLRFALPPRGSGWTPPMSRLGSSPTPPMPCGLHPAPRHAPSAYATAIRQCASTVEPS